MFELRVIVDNKETILDPLGACPECGESWAYEHDGKTYSKIIGIEVRGVYDGVCKYRCPHCTQEWKRYFIRKDIPLEKCQKPKKAT